MPKVGAKPAESLPRKPLPGTTVAVNPDAVAARAKGEPTDLCGLITQIGPHNSADGPLCRSCFKAYGLLGMSMVVTAIRDLKDLQYQSETTLENKELWWQLVNTAKASIAGGVTIANDEDKTDLIRIMKAEVKDFSGISDAIFLKAFNTAKKQLQIEQEEIKKGDLVVWLRNTITKIASDPNRVAAGAVINGMINLDYILGSFALPDWAPKGQEWRIAKTVEALNIERRQKADEAQIRERKKAQVAYIRAKISEVVNDPDKAAAGALIDNAINPEYFLAEATRLKFEDGTPVDEFRVRKTCELLQIIRKKENNVAVVRTVTGGKPVPRYNGGGIPGAGPGQVRTGKTAKKREKLRLQHEKDGHQSKGAKARRYDNEEDGGGKQRKKGRDRRDGRGRNR